MAIVQWDITLLNDYWSADDDGDSGGGDALTPVKVTMPLSSVEPAQAPQQSAGKKQGTNATVDVAGEAFDAYVANFEYGNNLLREQEINLLEL
jgi:hypothetical protein